jgi:hypothetical protein
MTVTASALAVCILLFLLYRGGGGRVSLIFSALAGAAIGGILVTFASAIFGGMLALGQTVLHAIS